MKGCRRGRGDEFKLNYNTCVQFSLSRAAGAPQESSQANLLVFVNSSGLIIVAISFEISIHFSWYCRHIVTWSFGRRSNVWEVRHTIGGEGLVGFQFEPIQMDWGISQNLFWWDIFIWDSFLKLLNVQSIVSFDGASQRNLENARKSSILTWIHTTLNFLHTTKTNQHHELTMAYLHLPFWIMFCFFQTCLSV